ncbi:serine/threonine protein phosphatase [Paenibacillus sp. MER 99-2]|nr:serine/threonine protein phosphatase [Paenibacillus sp. MER 99-2]
MRRCVISDIHGCYDEFNALLHHVSYDSVQDELILLGDYVDRGLKSRQVVDQIIELQQRHSIIALKGNHDAMMVKALTNDNKEYDSHWIRNGGLQTLGSYVNYATAWDENEFDWNAYDEAKVWVRNHYSHHLQFLDQLPLVYEIPGYVFVHAGINPDVTDWRKQPESDFMWIREPFYSRPTAIEETVVFGHTPVKYLHDEMGIWFSSTGDKIGIDGGCAYGAQLNMLTISEDGSLQTFFVKNRENAEDVEL